MVELTRLQQVRGRAREVVKRYGIAGPGTPVEKIIAGEKLELVLRSWGRDNPIGGLLFRGERTIAVNGDDVPKRRRFSMAHELGHYFLGHDYLRDYPEIDIDRPPEEDPHPAADSDAEQEAHHFANELLVPRPILIKLCPPPGGRGAAAEGETQPFNNPFAALRAKPSKLTPEQLADRFEVSTEVIYRALRYHGLL